MNSGGAQRQIIGLARCIQGLSGYDTRLLFYKDKADFYKSQLDYFNIDYYYDRSSCLKIHGFIALRKQIKDYKPDLIISFLGESNLYACINRLFCKIPLIVSERNTTIVPTYFDRIRFFLYRLADIIIPNSYSQCKYLCCKLPRMEHKIIPIINFVDTKVFYPIKKHNVNPIKNIIVTARVIPQKNVFNFIHAIKIVVDSGYTKFKIKWIGSLGVKDYVKECANLIDILQLSDHFSFVGECNNMLMIYSKADIFCLPSFYEGTPNALCEAMSCGLPILCSDVCDNSRYVKDNINGFLFNPHDCQSMADSIIKFLKLTDDKILDMGKVSRKKALADFSFEKFNDQWHEQIRQLIG